MRAARPAARGQHGMELLMGYILLVGVLLSAALTLAGLGWHWATSGDLRIDSPVAGTNLFQFVAADMREVTSVRLAPRLLINLGLAVLLLTPYARVAASVLYFAAAERSWKYTLFTGFVFIVLTYSLYLRP